MENANLRIARRADYHGEQAELPAGARATEFRAGHNVIAADRKIRKRGTTLGDGGQNKRLVLPWDLTPWGWLSAVTACGLVSIS